MMISCVIPYTFSLFEQILSDGVLFGSPSAASSRFIDKLRTKYSKSDSNLQEAAEALKRKPAPLCLQEPELLEVIFCSLSFLQWDYFDCLWIPYKHR